MLIVTLLRKVMPIKGFVYENVTLAEHEGKECVEVTIRHRENSKGICSGCGQKGPGYDHLPLRRFRHIPLWGIPFFLLYALRRVNCSTCGVKVERVPWAEGKHPVTIEFQWFLARWSKLLAWSVVAQKFGIQWHTVYASVSMAVAWGLQHRSLSNVTAIGIDEIKQSGPGRFFATLVYQINEGSRRLLWIGEHRKAKTLLRFFREFGPEQTAKLTCVCSDMWAPYIKVIKKKCSAATHVLDRFHIMANINQSVDEVRRKEATELKRQGQGDVLKWSRWCFLKRPENLTKKESGRLKGILKINLKVVRAYLLKEDFQHFWDYVSPTWAGKFFDNWYRMVMRSRIEPLKIKARSLNKHRELILNWFRVQKQFNNSIVEGLNNKAKSVTKQAYGFSTFSHLQTALFHRLGELPEPEFTHKYF